MDIHVCFEVLIYEIISIIIIIDTLFCKHHRLLDNKVDRWMDGWI